MQDKNKLIYDLLFGYDDEIIIDIENFIIFDEIEIDKFMKELETIMKKGNITIIKSVLSVDDKALLKYIIKRK